MKWTRVAGGVLLLAGLGFGVSQTNCTERAAPPIVACSASAISSAYREVDSVQSFGCVGLYAYLWATVGHGEGEVGVTEVARYDLQTSSWRNASRAHYCVQHRLPSYVQRWGCNSN
ncbi:MAG TPA: hypothetical protein VMF33_01055 [Acidimicrobiales bacterium]|nr:hypothetical protein [Acidimicrobiales bacterium]